MATTLASVARRAPVANFRFFSVLLLCVLVVSFGVVELTVRVGLARISNIEGRTDREYRAARVIRHSTGPVPNVLVIGSSWLLRGVDFPALQKSLATRCTLSRFVVEQTAYLDWYYGMRFLYARGARPDVVVLFLNGTDVAVNDLRGGYSACHLMLFGDVLHAARNAGLSPTGTFSLLLANLSAYYGTRVETRKFVLARLLPSVGKLRGSMVPPPRTPLDPRRAVDVASRRLEEFRALVQSHRGRFLFVEAPCRRPADAAWMSEASARTGVPVIVPMSAGSLHDADFLEDHEHLNPSGAARYTAALAPLLSKSLESCLPAAARASTRLPPRRLRSRLFEHNHVIASQVLEPLLP